MSVSHATIILYSDIDQSMMVSYDNRRDSVRNEHISCIIFLILFVFLYEN
jgi:hypothetical protein